MTASKSTRARNARMAAQASANRGNAARAGTAVKNGAAARNGGASGNGQVRTAGARNGAGARGARTPVPLIQDEAGPAGPRCGCSSPPSCWPWPGWACRST